MKKIISIIVICLFAKVSIAQNNTYEGNANTMTNFASSGAPTAYGLTKSYVVNAGVFSDTTSASAINYLKNYNGAQIMTYSGGVKWWLRYGGSWNQIGSGSSGWGLTGNAGTNPASNFIGTTDNIGLMFKTNSIQSGYIDVANFNTSFGQRSLLSNTSGNQNVAIGENAMRSNTTGVQNLSVGAYSMYSQTTGVNNTGIGLSALYYNVSGVNNTAVGTNALTNTTGGYNTSLGFYSGAYNTTQSNRLYINSLDRTNILGDTTKSIIYGYQDATASDQRLYLNSQLYLPYAASGVGTKALRINPSTGIVTYADTTAGGGISSDSLLWSQNGTNIFNKSGRNVGINTSTPSTALHVIGAIKATDSISFTGLLPMSASTDSVVVRDTNGKLGTTAKSAFAGSASLTSSYIGVGNGSNLLSGNSDFIKGAYVIELNQSSGGQQVGFRATNTSATSGNTNASLFVDNGTSAGQLFKAGTNYSAYKNISAHDLGFYNNSVAGNISVLNDYGNINFAAEGGSAATMTIKNGNVGINIAAPTSTLHAYGSVSFKANVIADADYSVTNTDYMISCKNFTSDHTITLPSAASFSGRILVIVPPDAAGGYKALFSVSIYDAGQNTQSQITSAQGGVITIQSDGTNWQVITQTTTF